MTHTTCTSRPGDFFIPETHLSPRRSWLHCASSRCAFLLCATSLSVLCVFVSALNGILPPKAAAEDPSPIPTSAVLPLPAQSFTLNATGGMVLQTVGPASVESLANSPVTIRLVNAQQGHQLILFLPPHIVTGSYQLDTDRESVAVPKSQEFWASFSTSVIREGRPTMTGLRLAQGTLALNSVQPLSGTFSLVGESRGMGRVTLSGAFERVAWPEGANLVPTLPPTPDSFRNSAGKVIRRSLPFRDLAEQEQQEKNEAARGKSE